MKKITIAIDGHSSCGKSTMAKDLARRINYIYIDTGAMYRTVTLYALRNGMMKAHGFKTLSKLRFERYYRKYSPYCSVASLYYYTVNDDRDFHSER